MTEYYDPMLAKLIAHAPNRTAAARRLAAACAAVEVWPVHSNAAFLARVAGDPAFVRAEIDTGFIDRHAAALIPGAEPSAAVIAAAAHALVPDRGADPWTALTGFRSCAPPHSLVSVAIGGRTHLASIDAAAAAASVSEIDGTRVLFTGGEAWSFGEPGSDGFARGAGAADGALRSPMPGRIVRVSVTEGQAVRKGQSLLVLEAMKMEHALIAPFDGVVADLAAREGEQVSEGVALVRIEAG